MTFRGVDNRRIQPYTRRITSVGGKGLSFSLGSFTNTSTRYMMIYNSNTGLWKMSGPFTSGILATDTVGGKRYGQFCSAAATVNTYSEVLDPLLSNWTTSNAAVTNNTIASPLGVVVADTVYENSANNTHTLSQNITPDGASPYSFSFFMRAKERYRAVLLLSGAGFVGTPQAAFNLSTGVASDQADCNFFCMLPFANGWYLCCINGTSDAAAATAARLYLANASGVTSYQGDGVSGLYGYGGNVTKAALLRPYIYVTTPAASTLKDQFYWSEAVIDAKAPWLRNGFRGSIIMSHATDEMLAADGGEHLIAAYNTTGAKGVVELYFDGADKKIKWRDDDTGALGESVAINNNLGDKIDIAWTLDNGSISTLWVNGGGISSATYNGSAATAAADGALYYGMDDSEALQLDVGHLSEPDPLT